jgi:protein O-mannosyl-transferase
MNRRAAVLLLVGVAALMYANALVNGFAFDDQVYVLNNPMVVTPSLERFLHPTTANNVFRPVTFGSFALNWRLSDAHPFSYHLVNVLLHMLVTVLLYLLLLRLLESTPRGAAIAFAAALLFAVHPIHTEAVTSIVGRSELLAAAFLLGAWLLHMQDLQVWALLCLLLAMMSKESAVVFLPLVFAGDYLSKGLKPYYRYAVITGVIALYLGVFWKIEGGRFGEKGISFIDNPLASLPAKLRILNASRIAWKYVWLQLYPATLSCDYSYNAIRLYANWRHTLPAVAGVLLVIGIWVWTVARKRNEWALAGALYLGAFAVTANFFVSTGTIMGERLVYLPSAGFCLLLALLWVRVENRQRIVAWTLLLVVGSALSMRTVMRNRDWHDDFSLFSSAVRAAPGSAKMHANFGWAYFLRGQVEPARAELTTALKIYPDFAGATESLGIVEGSLGHQHEARHLLEAALASSQRDDFQYNYRALNLAAFLVKTGDQQAALKLLNELIAESPGEARAWANRAVIRFQRGEGAAARSDAETALRLDPGNSQAQSVLGALNASGATAPKQ